MYDRIYRGTSLSQAEQEEFATGGVSGKTINTFQAFMDPENVEEDWAGNYLEEVPFETDLKERERGVVGGMSNRLGAADSFANGVPIVFHLDSSRLSRAQEIRYDYTYFDSVEGAMAWVDGTATGELRVNGSLVGLLVTNDGDTTIKYWGGDDLRYRANMYNEEMELIAFTDHLDVAKAVLAVTSYVRRPGSLLAQFDGYSAIESKLDPDATVISDWDESQVWETLYTEVRERVPDQYDYYLFDVDRHLAQETWGYEDRDVDAVWVNGERRSPSDVDPALWGE